MEVTVKRANSAIAGILNAGAKLEQGNSGLGHTVLFF